MTVAWTVARSCKGHMIDLPRAINLVQLDIHRIHKQIGLDTQKKWSPCRLLLCCCLVLSIVLFCFTSFGVSQRSFRKSCAISRTEAERANLSSAWRSDWSDGQQLRCIFVLICQNIFKLSSSTLRLLSRMREPLGRNLAKEEKIPLSLVCVRVTV